MPLEIDSVQFPRVHRITTSEQASFVYHRIPGQDGDLVQNLGRNSVRLEIEGIFYGPKAKESLEKLRSIHVKHTPVDFIADVMGSAYAGKVTLDRLDVTQSAAQPDEFGYRLVVTEYVPPPKALDGAALVNKKIALDAQAQLALMGLPDALSLGSIPEISNPFVPLKSALDPAKQAGDALQQSASALKTLFGV